MTHTKDDPALRSPEQREAIREQQAARAAVRSACTRSPGCLSQNVSLDALAAKYPMVAEVRAVNNDVADRLMSEFEKRASLMPEMSETFDWMRTLAGALRKVVS